MKKIENIDYLYIGITLAIGLAEGAHLAALFSGWSFVQCSELFLGAAALGLLCGGRRRWEAFWHPTESTR